eukprot:CAMPEP_0118710648 /NCGR_PEP_ID=MMETSP0800-20121206/23527_1 /TAXON_ID=210618 ORGANISM="Striatella unipunctata, Strain CCMP2910" /NCGR_SAMPLE_ID=MMETSP0800 /ASSEMBLY_ACC=CAM_ASM_000638 /LENGTH=218 /DNA_ID=CAMNT_0006614911 /DNA_START=68 /DNA_END=724 /DNA_ORIENTATION=-
MWSSSSSSISFSFQPEDMLYAFMLAIASSTDNFTVGLSWGWSRQKHYGDSIHQNALLISICNALGAFWSSVGGVTLSQHSNQYLNPSYLASFAFGYLAIKEWRSGNEDDDNNDDDEKNKNEETSSSSSLLSYYWTIAVQYALPMTLNNVAGGVVGGVSGKITPFTACWTALVASFLCMVVGYHLAKYLSSHASNCNLPNVNVSAMLMALLCVLSLVSA